MMIFLLILNAGLLVLALFELRRLKAAHGEKIEKCALALTHVIQRLNRRPANRVSVLKDGRVHHHCEVGSADYFDAYLSPGLAIQDESGTVIHGRQ